MKLILIAFLSLLTATAFAFPLSFTCDDNGPFGFGMLSRIDFVKKEGNQYLMTVYKERQGECCRYLQKKGETLISLIESPTQFGTFVTPENETNMDVSISLSKKKCKVKGLYSGGAQLKFKGKLVDWNPENSI